jgi:uncharacterized protein YndB with AHSA1/START domain
MSSGREVVLSRVFDAPRELVFKAWTEPERLKRWWGPSNFTNPVCEADARPGGAIRIHMCAPNGAVYPMTGVYREISPPERLVFTSAALDDSGNPMFEVRNTVTFEDQGGKTKLTLHASVVAETGETARFLGGAHRGWSESLERLAREVSR